MAHPGDLDTTFGSGGKKTVNFGGIDAAQAVLVQPNGRVVAAGGGGPASSFCVVRLRSANGTLDPTFGSGGKRVVDFGTDDESVYGAALQPDGKIVLAGDSRLQPAVVRLKANGTLDTSFDGDGSKLFSWGAIGRVTAVVVAPNGKILLGGFSGPEGGNIQVARLNANGAFDTTFGTAGIAAVDFGGTEFGEAIARQADGRILVVGRSSARRRRGRAAARDRRARPGLRRRRARDAARRRRRQRRARAARPQHRRRGQRERERDDDRHPPEARRLARHGLRQRRHDHGRLRLTRQTPRRRGAPAGRQDRHRRLHAGRRGRRRRAPERQRIPRRHVRRRREGDHRVRGRDVRQRRRAGARTGGSSSPARRRAATTSPWRACAADCPTSTLG